HALGLLGHARQVDVGLDLGLPVQLQDPVGNVHRLVADPLQVRNDLHGRGDEAQIPGGGLVQSQQFHAPHVHLDVVGVDLSVPVDDLLGQEVVTVQQRTHDAADLV